MRSQTRSPPAAPPAKPPPRSIPHPPACAHLQEDVPIPHPPARAHLQEDVLGPEDAQRKLRREAERLPHAQVGVGGVAVALLGEEGGRLN